MLDKKIKETFNNEKYEVLSSFKTHNGYGLYHEFIVIVDKKTREKVTEVHINEHTEEIKVKISNFSPGLGDERFERLSELKKTVENWFYKESTHRIRLLNKMIEFELEVNDYNLPGNLRDIPIERLNLSSRAYGCLRRDGYDTVGKIALLTKKEIYNIHQFGEKTFMEVINMMNNLGIELKDE